MTHDHREDIRDAAESRTAYLAAVLAGDDPTGEGRTDDEVRDLLDEWPLDVTVRADVWRGAAYPVPDLDTATVRLLLAVGGPTESVTVDTARGTVTYFHSWGREPIGSPCRRCGAPAPDVRRTCSHPAPDGWAEHDPADLHEIELPPDLAVPWLTWAADVIECYR